MPGAAEALLSLSPDEHLDPLVELVEEWSDAGSLSRKSLCAELPEATGFHAATVEKGLAVAWDDFRGEDLRECFERELCGTLESAAPRGFPSTALVLAGALPMPSWQALLLPLVLRSPLVAKPSRHDPVSPRLFRENLERLSPVHASAIRLLEELDHEAVVTELRRAGCVVAYGSDRTVSELAAQLEARQRFVAYGHRASFGVVGALPGERELEEAARGLALDIAVWDQLGCLSPVAVFADSSLADSLADAVASELAAAQTRWPVGRRSAEVAAAFADSRNDAEFRAAAGKSVRFMADPGGAWVVVREGGSALRPGPLHRFIRLHPFDELCDLAQALQPVRGQLAAIGLTGFGEQRGEAVELLSRLGPSRICPPGKMQAPPFRWRHDNQPLLLPLACAVDVEI